MRRANGCGFDLSGIGSKCTIKTEVLSAMPDWQ